MIEEKDKIILEINTKNDIILEKVLKNKPKEIWSFQEENEITEYLRKKYKKYENNFVTTSLTKKILLLKEYFDIVYYQNIIPRNNKVFEIIHFYLKEEGKLYLKEKINSKYFQYCKKEQDFYLYKKR